MRATDGSGLRKRQRDGFAAVPNDTVWDGELSTRSLGLLTKLIALPNDWKLETDWLVGKCVEGRDAVMNALRELRRLGYYRVERRRRPNGTFVSGVSISDVRVPEWAAQHAAACADQRTDKPKWDVILRLLEDGRVEDEPEAGPADGGTQCPPVANPQVEPGNGFSGSGDGPEPENPITGAPVTGADAVKTQTDIQTHTQGGSVAGVRHQDDVPGEQPPSPDGIQRTCPGHRLTPASGPCGRCGDWRRAVEAAGAQTALDAAQRAQEARDAARQASALAEAEQANCRLCDAGGRLPSGLVCLHDPAANPRPDSGGFAEFQRLRAAGVKRSTDGRDPETGRRRARAARAG